MLSAIVYRDAGTSRQVPSGLPPVRTQQGTLVWQGDRVALLGPEGLPQRELAVQAEPRQMLASPDGSVLLLVEHDRLVARGAVEREVPIEPGAEVALLGKGGVAVAGRQELRLLDARLEEVKRVGYGYGRAKLLPLAQGQLAVLTYDRVQVLDGDGELVHESEGRAPTYRMRVGPDGSLYYLEEARLAPWFGGGWSAGYSLKRYQPGEGVARLTGSEGVEPLADGWYLDVGERGVVLRDEDGWRRGDLSFRYREYLDRVRVSPDGRAALVSTRQPEGDRRLFRLDLEGRRFEEIHRSRELFEAWFTPEGEVTLDKPAEREIEFPLVPAPAPAVSPRGFLVGDQQSLEGWATLSSSALRRGEETLEAPEGDRFTAGVAVQIGLKTALAVGTAQGRVYFWPAEGELAELALSGPITGFSAVEGGLAAVSPDEVLVLENLPAAELTPPGGQVADAGDSVVIGGVRVRKAKISQR